MPLDKQKISVNLSRGMREDVDEFVLEPPHTEYLENARLSKDACIQKRRGDTQLADLGALNGTPRIFAAQDNTLVTISDSTIHRYSGTDAAWRSTALAHPLYGSERKLSTSAARGAGLFSMAVTPTGYVVAYEIRKTSESDGSPDVSVVLEGYGGDGELIWRDSFFGINPEVHQTFESGVLRNEVLFVYTAFQQPSYTVNFVAPTMLPGATYTKIYNSETGVQVGVTNLKSSAVAIYNPYALAHYYFNTTNWLSNTMFRLKVGQCMNCWQSAQTRAHMNRVTEEGVVAYATATTNHVTSPTGVVDEIDRDGIATGNTWTFQVAGTHTHITVLDAKMDDSGWAHVLWATREPTSEYAGNTVLKYGVKDLSGATTFTTTVIGTGDFLVSQGSIGVKSTFEPAFISYRVDLGTIGTPTPSDTYPSFDQSYTEIREITAWAGGITLGTGVKLRGHGLASGILIEPTTNKAYQCLEQYNDYTPLVTLGVAQTGECDLPPAVKQVTTVLCEITTDQDQPAIPVATLDAGTSKHIDAARSMQCNHLNTLFLADDGAFVYINRNLLSIEDHALEVGGTWNLASGDYTRGHNNFSLALGNARGSVYRVNDDYDLDSTVFGDGLMVNTALPLWIDEGSVGEAAILDQPEIIVLEEESATNRPVAWAWNELAGADWWQFQAVIGYTDQSGNVHRSSPSAVLYIDGLDPTGVPDPGQGYLTAKVIPPITLNPEQPYFCDIYAAASGENPRLVTQTTFLPKDVFEDGIEVSWQHMLHRQDAAAAPPRSTKNVYTTGGEFASDPWSPFGASVVTSRRMFALSTSLVGTVFYTKLFQENVAPEFTASAVLSLGDARKLRAIGTIDDKVIVFEKDAVHVIFGDGPDNTGRGSDFGVQRLQTDVGCEDPESVVEIPQGLMFYSSVSKEFHLIDRQLQLHGIGAPVKGLTTDIDVLSATVIPEEHEVRFLVDDTSYDLEFGQPPAGSIGSLERPPRPKFRNVLPTDPVLVYNYERDAWWVNSNMDGEVSTLFQNLYTRIASDFDVFQENRNTWQSVTGDNLLKVTTPWFNFDGLAGFVRVRKAVITGRYMSDFASGLDLKVQAGDMKVTASYDYEQFGTQHEKTYRANVELQPDAERFQVRFRPGKQKCQSIRFEIEEVATGSYNVDDPVFGIGRGFEITGIDLEVAMKGGLVKTLSAQRNSG